MIMVMVMMMMIIIIFFFIIISSDYSSKTDVVLEVSLIFVSQEGNYF